MNLSKTEKIDCPFCNSSNYKKKYAINNWTIVKCSDCSLAYVNPRLVKEELENIYTSNYFDNTVFGYTHYTDNKELRKKNFRRWINEAIPFLKKDISIKALDIGCATGYCLEVFKEKGWQAHGIELDKNIAAKLTTEGYIIFDSPLTKTNFRDQYSFISLFDVIEHLTDITENFDRLYNILDNDGIIVIITPNYKSIQRKLFGKKWFQFKPLEHINYFDLDTLKKIADESGFKIIYSQKPGQYTDINFLKNRLSKYNFRFLMPILNIATTLFNLQRKPMYIDTSSLYLVLQKK